MFLWDSKICCLVIFVVITPQVVVANPNVGIKNQNGNDCFVNSSMQALSYATPLFDFAGKHANFKSNVSQSSFFEFMNNLKTSESCLEGNDINNSSREFRSFWTSNYPDMRSLADGQQDAGEFVTLILDKILNQTPFREAVTKELKNRIFNEIDDNLEIVKADDFNEILGKFVPDDKEKALLNYKTGLVAAIGKTITKIDSSGVFYYFCTKFFEIFNQHPYNFEDIFLNEMRKNASTSDTLRDLLDIKLLELSKSKSKEISDAKKNRKRIEINGVVYKGNQNAKYEIAKFYSESDGTNFAKNLVMAVVLKNLSTLLENVFSPGSDFWKSKNLKTNLASIRELFSIFYLSKNETIDCDKCTVKFSNNSAHTLFEVNIPDQKKSVTLDNCIKDIFEEKFFSTCSFCGNYSKKTRRYKIEMLPQVLIILLVRFTFGDLANKIETKIAFPEELNLNKYFSNELIKKIGNNKLKYNLCSFIVHGGGASGGHYWAYGKDGNDWYKYEDSVVNKANESILKIISSGTDSKSTPYILFYKLDEASAKILQTSETEKIVTDIDIASNLLNTKLKTLATSANQIKESVIGCQKKLSDIKKHLLKK